VIDKPAFADYQLPAHIIETVLLPPCIFPEFLSKVYQRFIIVVKLFYALVILIHIIHQYTENANTGQSWIQDRIKYKGENGR
jgi:hypothetical protein